MKTENRELLGFTVPIVGIVETLAEAITAAGSEQEVCNTFNANVLAHSHYTVARKAIIKSLVEQSGIKQNTKGGTGKDKDEVTEKDAAYVARLENEVGEEMVKSFGAKVAEAVKAIPVDYSPGTRGAGGSATPAKKWLAYVDQLIAEDKLDTFCSKNGIDKGSFADEESLKFAVANKVREIVTAKLEAAAQAALAGE